MAARKKTARPTRRKKTRSPLERLEQELPANLKDFSRRIRKQLNQLEREVEKAGIQTRRRAARLIREASHQLGRLEAKGEPGWRQLTVPYRKELVGLLKRLERSVAPKPARRTARKKTARKKTTRKATTPPSPA